MNMDKKVGTLGLFLYVGEGFTVGDIHFFIEEIRENSSEKGQFFTCLLSYSPTLKENAAVVLYQHKELVFYHDVTFKMWLGKQTSIRKAHIFICADKTIKINRDN